MQTALSLFNRYCIFKFQSLSILKLNAQTAVISWLFRNQTAENINNESIKYTNIYYISNQNHLSTFHEPEPFLHSHFLKKYCTNIYLYMYPSCPLRSFGQTLYLIWPSPRRNITYIFLFSVHFWQEQINKLLNLTRLIKSFFIFVLYHKIMLKQFHIIHFNPFNIMSLLRDSSFVLQISCETDTNKMTLDDPLYFDDGFTPGF